jgi:purine-binding chemotaxis protein CheW
MRPLLEAGQGGSFERCEYITVLVADQMFGLAIEGVHDVFIAQALTPVPLAPPDIAGLLNLRGRVVTAISLRSRLGLVPRSSAEGGMVVGLERNGESYGMLVDSVGEVVFAPAATFEPLPINFDPLWSRVSRGIHRLDPHLMVVLDIDQVLDLPAGLPAPRQTRATSPLPTKVMTP